jgi:hypothetical protein
MTYAQYVSNGYHFADWLQLSFFGKARCAFRGWPRYLTISLSPFALRAYRDWGFATSQDCEYFHLGPLVLSWWCK